MGKLDVLKDVICGGIDGSETANVVSVDTVTRVDGGSRGRECEGKDSNDSTEGTHFEMRGLVVKEGKAPKLGRESR